MRPSTGKYICHNGEIVPDDTPVFTGMNRAFRYGDALFETIRVTYGNPHFIEDHLQRMRHGMDVLKMKVPASYSVDHFTEKISSLAKKNKIPGGGRVRLTVYRNDGGLYTPSGNGTSYLVEVDPLNDSNYKLNKRGLEIDVYHAIKKPLNILSNLKTANCLLYIMAGIHKTTEELDDCLILNERGNIAEAVSSNIFLVRDGILSTPSLSEGCVAGVMLRQVIRIAGTAGLKINECEVPVGELDLAEEVFLTNAISGISWVKRFRDKQYGSSIAGKLVVLLNKLEAGSREPEVRSNGGKKSNK